MQLSVLISIPSPSQTQRSIAPTLGIKELLLWRIRIVDSIELKRVFLILILGVWNPYDGIPVPQCRQLLFLGALFLGSARGGLSCRPRTEDDIQFPLGLQEWPHTRNDPDTHIVLRVKFSRKRSLPIHLFVVSEIAVCRLFAPLGKYLTHYTCCIGDKCTQFK